MTEETRSRFGEARRRIRTRLRLARAVLAHERTPRASKWLLGGALAYAAMPFDLVPDWIPILGQLDDILIVGLLVWLAWRLVPEDVLAECRRASE
ncbi:MAG: YkvA family protein [Candidatus Eisenbacteria bacterium]